MWVVRHYDILPACRAGFFP